MKRKLIIFAILLVMTVFWLPRDNPVSAQNGQGNSHRNRNRGNNERVWQPGKHSGAWRKKNEYGYKNYGQYRRTQNGNRRYRLAKRYYWNSGTRLSRSVRIYF